MKFCNTIDKIVDEINNHPIIILLLIAILIAVLKH